MMCSCGACTVFLLPVINCHLTNSSFEDRKECHTYAVVYKCTSASLRKRINNWQRGISGMTHCCIKFYTESVAAFKDNKTWNIAGAVRHTLIESLPCLYISSLPIVSIKIPASIARRYSFLGWSLQLWDWLAKTSVIFRHCGSSRYQQPLTRTGTSEPCKINALA